MVKPFLRASVLSVGLMAGATGAMAAGVQAFDVTVSGSFAQDAPFSEVDILFRINVDPMNIASTLSFSPDSISAVTTPSSGFDVPTGFQISLNNDLFALDSNLNGPPLINDDFVDITIDGFANFITEGEHGTLTFSYAQADQPGALHIGTGLSATIDLAPEEEDSVGEVPVPAAGVLLLTALAGLGFVRRRRTMAAPA